MMKPTCRLSKPLPRRYRSQGFSLLEVLISLLIIAFGLLGLAKMQALGFSGTQVSRVRSLVALQTGSLAAAMRMNRQYWAGRASALNFGASSTDPATTPPSANVTGLSSVPAAGCATKCTPASLAAYDVQQWANSMAAWLPGFSFAGSCTAVVAAPNAVPTRCTLTVSWIEKYVAAGNSAVDDSSATGGERNFVLYVEP